MHNFFPVKLFTGNLLKFLNNKYSSVLKPLISVPRFIVYMEIPYIVYKTNKMTLENKQLTIRFSSNYAPHFLAEISLY